MSKQNTSSLENVSEYLRNKLSLELPGAPAHNVMRATWASTIRPTFSFSEPPRPGGVLILLYEENGRVKFPLIKRPIYVGAHSGQMSLPGGKAESGEDTITAALRECEEEIGVDRNYVDVLGTLSNFHVEPSNFIITPVIATISFIPTFVPDPFEVAGIVQANLFDITNDDVVKVKEIEVGKNIKLNAPHFEIAGEVVWGATAMMLNEFREILIK